MAGPLGSALIAFLGLTVADVGAWTPGTGHESKTFGFTVNTQVRNDVISFWHCVYKESEGYEGRIAWTGSINTGNPGATSTAFKNDVERRINFYRAMAGLSSNIDITTTSTVVLSGSTPSTAKPSASTTKSNASQAAALMLSSNTAQFLPGGGVATGSHNPHDPPGSWFSDTSTARNGAYHSNLAIGKFGPGAIDAYMLEDDQAAAGGDNDDVGHRRFIFYSRVQEMATGDVTNTPNSPNDYFAANALYVSGNLLPPSSSPEYVPWPNRGFVPEPLVPERWSLSYPNADFSSATVSMTDSSGAPITTTVVSHSAIFGDATIAWTPNAASILSAESIDRTYHVTVSNIIIGGVAQSYSYTTTVINPDRLLESSDLSGSVSPPSSGADYFFDEISHSEEHELQVLELLTASWTEGAEDGASSYIEDNTSSAYDLRAQMSFSGHNFWDTGSKAFRLTFPDLSTPYPTDNFVINRTIIPRTGAQLTFRLRRGYMVSESKLEVQTSIDGGATWSSIATYSGNGSLAQPDLSFSTETLSLTQTNQNVLIRFYLHRLGGSGAVFSVSQYPTLPTGIFIDGISVSNTDWLNELGASSYSASSDRVTLNDSAVGGTLTAGSSYMLRKRTRVGCHWFPFGAPLTVVPVLPASLTDYEKWYRESYAIIGDFDDDYDGDGVANGLERVFDLDPLDSNDGTSAIQPVIVGGNLQLSHAIIPGASVSAEYSHTLLSGSWSPVTVTISGGVATASLPVTAGSCFIRWRIVEP